MAIYTRDIRAIAVPSGVYTCVELPAPMRGELERLLIKQVSGADAGYTCDIYDRKGACTNASDLHTLNGAVTSVTEIDGAARITVTESHGLRVGDTIELKLNSVAAYNTIHTVVAVVSATVVDTDATYSNDGAGGLWQTTPELEAYATSDPSMHRIAATVTVAGSGGGNYANFSVAQYYENRDNQNITARRRAQAIYLDLKPAGTGDKNFEISYTVKPEVVC